MLVGNYVAPSPGWRPPPQQIGEVGGFDERLGLCEDADHGRGLGSSTWSVRPGLSSRQWQECGRRTGSLMTGRERGDYVRALATTTSTVLGRAEPVPLGRTGLTRAWAAAPSPPSMRGKRSTTVARIVGARDDRCVPLFPEFTRRGSRLGMTASTFRGGADRRRWLVSCRREWGC